MRAEIKTTKDMAKWLEVMVPQKLFSYEARLRDFIDALNENEEEIWKKCKRCGAIKLYIDGFRDDYSTYDDKAYKCRQCSNAVTNRNRNRKRLSDKMPADDLAEIQRIRSLKGLDPLPLGPDLPKPGRPKEAQDGVH